MNLTKTIMSAIEGAAYVPRGAAQGLADYHKAQAVKAALRRRNPIERLCGVREALNQYRVSAWLTPESRIRLVLDGRVVAVL